MSLLIQIPRLALLTALGVTAFANPAPPVLFRDPALPLAQRVDDLIGRLTVAEKITQTMMDSPALPRLGVARFHWWSEALHGVARNGTATVFPQAIALAATWNPPLVHQVAEVISTEARAKYHDLLARQPGQGSGLYQGLSLWSPNINIFRDPRWGRGQETYGEDPFLTSRLGVAFLQGLQGDDPDHLKTVATLKHFAVHSGPENLRHKFDAVVSARDLHETYLPAFEAGIREGHAQAVMSAYNAVNGLPAPANRWLLQDVLRTRWGFTGAVVGDVDTVHDIFAPNAHKFAPDAATASALALKAGNDLCSGETYRALPEALQRGLLTEADLDVALRRLFTLRFKLGEFDPPERSPHARIPFSENDSPAHRALAVEAARQSLVLLKNDGTLPWKPSALKTVAVIGPAADDRAALLGNYSGIPSRYLTLLEALRSRLEPTGVRVLSARGAPLAKGFREDQTPVPADVVFTDETRTENGLKREVFADAGFSGDALSSTVDTRIDHLWNTYYPFPGIPAKGAVLRWSGLLIPKVSGHHLLSITATGGFRLTLDSKTVIDSWPTGPERTATYMLTATAGQAYRLRLDFDQGKASGLVRFGWKPPGDEDPLGQALAAAREADHIVLALGLTPDLEGEEMKVDAEGFVGGDRSSILLPRSQRELLAHVSALGKPVTVVLTTGSALSFDTSQANAILCAWYYGQGGGEAVAETLLGKHNAGGRLPITFYRSEADLPPFEDYAMQGRTYRFFTGKPLYAFGHGLSYTTFAYESVRLSSAEVSPTGSVTVNVTLKNTGPRRGDEVVQLYAHAVRPPVPMPEQSLVGFQRVTLDPGEGRTIALALPVSRLKRWDDQAARYVVDPGAYELRIGGASDVPALRTQLHVRLP